MGTVHLARDTKLGRMVAVKILPLNSGDDARRRFIREARAVGALDHPNICTIHEVGEDHGQSYIVMQYVEGRNLASWINAGELDLERSLDCAIQVCGALQAAHDHGIIHRDVKPSNVMLAASGKVKVLDFGIAKVLDQDTEQTDMLTRPGTVPGTRPYMSPEQLRGERLDARSDIFSFGVMLYEMVSGRRPFEGGSMEATITAILFFDPPKIESTSPTLLKIESVIRKALHKDPHQRYQRIADLAEELLKISAGHRREESAVVEGRTFGSKEPTRTAAPVTPRRRKRVPDSVAVIPRISSRADPELAYLLEGIAEAIIQELSHDTRLRVLSRSTAFRFQEGDFNLQALRRDLNVALIATVKITAHVESIDVDIQLVETANGESILARQYSGAFEESSRIAEHAARDVLAAIRPASTRKRRVATRKTPDAHAYQLFLKGRFQWNKRSPEGVKQAIDLYQQVNEIDPTFAPAYVGLADAYNMLGFLSVMPPRLVFPKAKAAAQRAIELDPAGGEAYASLGFTAGLYEWNFRESVRLHGEAIQRNPSYAMAYHWRALTGFLPQGQFDEALRSVRQAEELDPLAPIMNTAVGVMLLFSRRYEEAREVLEHIREIEPKFAPVHWYLAITYEQLHRYDDALTSVKTVQGLSVGSLGLALLGHCYAVAGHKDEALKVLADAKQLAERSYVSAYVPLLIQLGLADDERALESLKAAVEERMPWLALAPIDPRFDRLHASVDLENLINSNALRQ